MTAPVPASRSRLAALAIGWAGVALMIALSLGPAPSVGVDTPMADKWGHAAAYATLMAWFSGLYPRLPVQAGYFAGFFMLGLALEGIQGLLPLRQASGLDALANLTGLLIGLGLMRLVSGRQSA